MTIRRPAARMAVAAAVCAAATLLALALTTQPSPLAASDGWIEGILYRFFAPARPTSDRIVIIGITDDTLAQLPYGSPVDRGFLAGLIDALRVRQVAAIGLDILIDRPTVPEKDELLREALDRARPIVVLATVGPETPISDTQKSYLDRFLAGRRTGFANLPRDTYDSMVRRYLTGTDDHPSFGAALATVVGESPPWQSFRITWRRQVEGRPFQIFPAHLAPLLPPEWLRGKIALIGSLVPGEDEHRTPLAILTRPLHGVEIHAHALSQILEHGTSEDNVWVRPILVGAAAAAGTALATSLAGAWFVAGLVLLLVLIWAGAIAGFAAVGGPPIVPLAPSLGLLVAAGSIRAWRSSSERRDKRTLQHLFARFVGEPVLRELWEERDTFLSGGRPRPRELTATVLFSDIAGFTPLCEKLPPEPLYAWLDRYIDAMVEVVNRHGGIVLRFIGDGILAVFGVPIARHAEAEIDADAQNAVHCARAMLGELQELNAVWRAEGLPSVVIRVGIYTGKLLAGSLGSGSHMEYCLQGDTVNSAARIEALGKSYLREGDAGIILIGETTAARLDGLFAAEKVGEIRLKGKERVTTIFRIPDD